jgi:hypothetical protein
MASSDWMGGIKMSSEKKETSANHITSGVTLSGAYTSSSCHENTD